MRCIMRVWTWLLQVFADALDDQSRANSYIIKWDNNSFLLGLQSLLTNSIIDEFSGVWAKLTNSKDGFPGGVRKILTKQSWGKQGDIITLSITKSSGKWTRSHSICHNKSIAICNSFNSFMLATKQTNSKLINSASEISHSFGPNI